MGEHIPATAPQLHNVMKPSNVLNDERETFWKKNRAALAPLSVKLFVVLR